ncbi:MAG: dethiobiotin synthase, partial [Anaerovorax sp.]
MSKKLFVTGTGTDIGKTFVTGLIVKKLNEEGKRVAYYKAAMSGNDRRPDGTLIPGDALHVKTISRIEQPLSEMCPYIYEMAVSPHLASRLEGNPVQLDRVLEGFDALCTKYDYITIEGSGGILCPICVDETKLQLEDIIKELNASCLIIADAGLGTINDVGLTVAYMKEKNIPIKGIIFNRFKEGDVMHEDNL